MSRVDAPEQRALADADRAAAICRELDLLRPQLQGAPFDRVALLWEVIEHDAGVIGKAWLGRNDRFYILVRLLHRKDAIHPWLYERCREVEANPDGFLDLWAREHYKSTIITFAGILQEVARDPEITIGIFSFNKNVARKFLFQIKQELETNRELQAIYPEVFWDNPEKLAPKWSLDGGLVCRRKGNPKEATIEAHGLVDGQPTGAHFALRVYDDVVTLESITSPEMVKKTTTAWEVSDNLGARGEDGFKRAWHIGTRYSFADTYATIIERGALKVRIYAATDTGLATGKPVFLSEAAWAELKTKQGPATVACQQLMNPAAGQEAMFRKEWLSFLDVRPATLNVYIMVDPANSKTKGSDNTAIAVIGVDTAMNMYLLDGYRHKMALSERWTATRDLRRFWMRQPGVQMVKVGYEKYGMQSDLDHFKLEMEREKESFEILELNWVLEGQQSKDDRVQRLQPAFLQRKFHLAMVCTRKVPSKGSDGQELKDANGAPIMVLEPYETANQKRAKEVGQGFRIFNPVRRRDHEGNAYSLNKGFLEEYLTYPFSSKKDLIDAASRIYDMEPVPPILIEANMLEPETFED